MWVFDEKDEPEEHFVLLDKDWSLQNTANCDVKENNEWIIIAIYLQLLNNLLSIEMATVNQVTKGSNGVVRKKQFKDHCQNIF